MPDRLGVASTQYQLSFAHLNKIDCFVHNGETERLETIESIFAISTIKRLRDTLLTHTPRKCHVVFEWPFQGVTKVELKLLLFYLLATTSSSKPLQWKPLNVISLVSTKSVNVT